MANNLSPAWLGQAKLCRRQFCKRVWWSPDFAVSARLDARGLNALIASADTDRGVLKHDRTSTVVRARLGDRDVIIKRYNARSLWHRLNRSVRRSRASRSWQRSHDFAKAGLNVAQPLAMIEQRFGLLRRTAYFVSEFVDGDQVLECLPRVDQLQKEAIARAMSMAFERLSAAHLSHGDLKASNLIWFDGQLFFIDLDAAQKYTHLARWRAAHHKDKKRFLKNWQGDPELLALFSELE